MNVAQAQHYADSIIQWLGDKCHRVEIAGSIRRGRPICNDIDLVCIPKVDEEHDMLGAAVSRNNHLFNFMKGYAAQGKATIRSGGEREGKQMVVELKKCQLDLWFADEKTFATRLLCRTGSMEHNIWLADRAKRQGKKWNPYEGILYGGKWRSALGADEIYEGGQMIQFASEADLYASLDLPYIEPKDREYFHLVKTYGA